MRQDARQMGEEALVDGKEALGLDRLGEAVKDALVQIAVLVVQPRHDSVCTGLAK